MSYQQNIVRGYFRRPFVVWQTFRYRYRYIFFQNIGYKCPCLCVSLSDHHVQKQVVVSSFFSPSGSDTILVFPYQTSRQKLPTYFRVNGLALQTSDMLLKVTVADIADIAVTRALRHNTTRQIVYVFLLAIRSNDLLMCTMCKKIVENRNEQPKLF